MTLLLDNDDVRALLDMRQCIDALEAAFGDYARGEAVNRPRSHTYTQVGDGLHYLFKTMDGSVPRFGVHALRLTSDLTHEHAVDGRRRRDKIPAAPGSRYVGLVLLFDLETLVPLAILQDGYLQQMRVGATSALAADRLARAEARRVGMIGAGRQAAKQLEGLRAVRDIADVRVYAPTRDRLEAFCAQHDATPVGSARESLDGADIVVLATNAHEPVLEGDWLVRGQHVNSLQRHELDEKTIERADVIVLRSRDEPTFVHAPGRAPLAAEHRSFDAKVVELGEVVTGDAGRRSDDDITLFTGGGGLGIQFAAAASVVYRAALERGVGRELPTEWFTQVEKP